MRTDDLRKALRAVPFEPFRVRVVDGREYRVDHPEFMAIAPDGRRVVVFDTEGLVEWVDTLMIASLHFGNGKAKRTRGKQK